MIMEKRSTSISLYLGIFLPALLFLSGCQQKNNLNSNDGWSAINADSLKQNIAVLSSDSLGGRQPLTQGEISTIRYLQQQFSAAGLEPGNNGSFLQEVPMVKILAMAAPEMLVQSPKGNLSLKAYDDYIIWTDKTDENISFDRSELIFAGYGVVAPEYGWNDYEGLDVKGKVVLVMVNDPGFWAGDTSLFKGKRMTYYGRWTYKFEEAARQGAKGCLIIHNTAAAGYPFIVQQNSFNSPRMILDNRGKDVKNCDVIGWLPETIAKKLFQLAGKDSGLLAEANKPGFKALPLNINLSTSMKVQATYGKSHNVIGMIRGTKYPNEVIIYTAHWDHLGIGMPDATGDSIYNGAFDNATATAGLVELARAFKSMKATPERTVVFLSVTAEEEGLLGSEYYVQNPVFPLNKTLANINMECLNWSTRTKDMVIIGAGLTEVEDYFTAEVNQAGGYITAETQPEVGSYFRSDHFSFAKAGIPALYAVTGVDVEGKGQEYGKQRQEEYYSKNYHRPSDEYNDTTWIMEGALEELKLLFLTGKQLTLAEKWPEWKPGSEFKRKE